MSKNEGGAMDREQIEEYNRQQKKQEPDFLLKSDRSLDTRIEGLVAIKNIINPRMSMSTFHRRHRRHLDYILMEDRDAWRTNRPRYFTYLRLIYHYLLSIRKV